MSGISKGRADEVSQYYAPAVKAATADSYLFWFIAIASLCMPKITMLDALIQNIITALFIVLVVVHFVVNQISRLYLVPKAEKKRRQQMLSDAFGSSISCDKTSLYYNNDYSPSLMRLGANTMENALFSKEITAKMLVKNRLVIGLYMIIWLFMFAFHHGDVDILIWVTQLVFSGAIIANWLTLEIFKNRCENVYIQLHAHFLHEVGADNEKAVAAVLDVFASYEAAKASAGSLLSSKIFNQLNPSLTQKWEQIRTELKMEERS